MFQNIDEAGLYSYFTLSPPTPALTLTDTAAQEKLRELETRVREAEARVQELREQRRSAFGEWLKQADLGTLPLIAGEQARFLMDEVQDRRLTNSIKADQPATMQGENRLAEGKNGSAIQFTGDDPVDLPLGNFHRHQPFSISLWLKTPDEKARAVVMHRSRAWTDAASRGYELLIEDGRLKWSLIHFWPGNAISVGVLEKLPLNEWIHVTVVSDGSSRASGLSVYVNGQPAKCEIIKDDLTREITGGGGDNIALGERFRDRGFRDGLVDDVRVFDAGLTTLEALAVYDEANARSLVSQAASASGEALREQLFDLYLLRVDDVYKQALRNSSRLESTMQSTSKVCGRSW